MADNLVIVESPAKAKTIKKYLGKDFEVLASYGHVRDLVPKEGAVDPDHGFAMQYQPLEKNERHIESIAKALKKAKTLYLATDPDREGEAISWHLSEILKQRGELAHKKMHRVVFYEITKSAVREAISQPRDLSFDLVNAQQARRALDYLVGFNLSPLLWKKLRRGLSAGRVQSPALRMICEREEEIAAFVPQEYWTLDGEGEHSAKRFPLKLIEYKGTKVEQFSFPNGTTAAEVESSIIDAARAAGASGDSLGTLKVLSIDRKERRRNPAPPFTTSTLQQEAARKLGFNARRTMRLAQQLYEGVDIGDGAIGLITYMRTDSVNLADEAVREIREVAGRLYGQAEVAEEPRVYKTKSKNAQEAHEAIRPTSAAIVPADIESKLDPDQYKLYSLIWKRAVASQMSHAVFDTVAVDMLAGPDGPQRHVLRANGSTLVKPGYMSVYQEDADDVKRDDDDHVLPAMNEGDKVALAAFKAEQHFTEPPPRYSEASLVKALEEYGIGRPSTYATIISTLQDREYVEMDNRRFIPTDIGKIVGRFLSQYFTRYVANDFTAALEDELDAVSRGEEEWTIPLSKFWKPFIKEVEKVEKNVSREQVAMARDIGVHPESGKPMSVRMGRFGPFVQIGTKDDEEKPKFAGLRPGQKMDTITLEQALELFKLPRTIGKTAEGEDVVTNVGRFGPYIKYGTKYVSLKEDDPYTVELPRALELIRLKQEADANRIIANFESDGIQVLNGRYGPYVTNGKKNAKIPKDRDPKSITLEEARVMIEQAPERGTGRFGRGKRVAPGKNAAGAAAAAPAGAAAKRAAKKSSASAGNGTDGANGADGVAQTAKAGKAAKAGASAAGAAKAAGAAAKSASAHAPTTAKKTAASNKPSQPGTASARTGKSARGSGPVPKGVSNVVRKGQSAAAKAHARKTARPGPAGSASKTAKPAAKRARS